MMGQQQIWSEPDISRPITQPQGEPNKSIYNNKFDILIHE